VELLLILQISSTLTSSIQKYSAVKIPVESVEDVIELQLFDNETVP